MAKRVGKVRKDQGQGLSSMTCLGELPVSCGLRSPSSKRLKAQIDDDAISWEVPAFAYDAVSKGPSPTLWYPCTLCFGPFPSAQGLGGQMNGHRHERLGTKARKAEGAVAAAAVSAAAATAEAIEVCNNVAAVEILRPAAQSKADADMATLLRLLGLPPLLGTAARFSPPQFSSLSLLQRKSKSVVPGHTQSCSTDAGVLQPQSLSLRLSQMQSSSKVVLGHPPSYVTTAKFQEPHTFRFSVLERSSASAVPSPESIASTSSECAFHPYQGQKPVELNCFPTMVAAPLDLELCLGRSFGN